MFLYVAAVCALIGGADAAKIDHFQHHVDVAGIMKYAHAHSSDAASAVKPNRNLRDMHKPDDAVFELYRDDQCTVHQANMVMHGNTIHVDHPDDGSPSSNVKIGCAVGPDGKLYHDYLNYGNNDGTGDYQQSQMVPFFGNENGMMPGQCVMMPSDDNDTEGPTYAKIGCSGKDPFRDAHGYHMLEYGELRECHSDSLKTNRALNHQFIPFEHCMSMEPGRSIMGVPGCGDDRHTIMYREDENSETCANLGDIKMHTFKGKCKQDGMLRELCVDSSTGPQQ